MVHHKNLLMVLRLYKVILKEAKHYSFQFQERDRGGKSDVGFVMMNSLSQLFLRFLRRNCALSLESEQILGELNGEINM